jgi:signal transduction histidine kinase
MKPLLLTLIILLPYSLFSQINLNQYIDTLKKQKDNVIFNKENAYEAVWDQGLPILPDDETIMNLIEKLDNKNITDVNKITTEQVRLYRELGIEFYNKGLYQEADFYLSKIKNYSDKKRVKLKEVFRDSSYYSNISQIKNDIRQELEKEYQGKKEQPVKETKPELSISDLQNLKKDTEFLKSLPKTFESLSKDDLENLSKQLDNQIQKLQKEKDELVKNNGSQELIDAKDVNIKSLKKEKQVVDLNIDKEVLREEKQVIKNWLWGSVLAILVLVLSILALLQRRTIKVQDAEIERQLEDINKKNTYLEHAARIIRHDMHSGINTYIPRGIGSLEKRLTPEQLIDLRIDGSVKMIREGLNHTQKVYKSVYEFTNLVKQNVVLDKKEVDIKQLLEESISKTSYTQQVELGKLPTLQVNETLFWNAIDNLIKNGLKYNDSESKLVKIYLEDDTIIVQDNGRGLSEKQFEKIIKAKDKDIEEAGLGLNICLAIIKEHGFELSCEKISTGTKMKIKVK